MGQEHHKNIKSFIECFQNKQFMALANIISLYNKYIKICNKHDYFDSYMKFK